MKLRQEFGSVAWGLVGVGGGGRGGENDGEENWASHAQALGALATDTVLIVTDRSSER